jgi:hypothetical protein
MSEEWIAHFWDRVAKGEGCWEWQGGHNPWGYGRVARNGTMSMAHRVAYEIASGLIPDGLLVLHTCDNPICVRNDDEGWYEVDGVLLPRRGHLFLGNDADNMKDKMMKDRQTRGEQLPHAKLTEEQVRAIRKRYAAGGVSLESLGHEYGVSLSATHLIVHRRNWAHVAD